MTKQISNGVKNFDPALLFFYVYVLKMQTSRLYIGSTKDLSRRLEEHKKAGKQFILIFYEAYRSEEDARIREKQLKNFGSAYGHLKNRIVKSLEYDH